MNSAFCHGVHWILHCHTIPHCNACLSPLNSNTNKLALSIFEFFLSASTGRTIVFYRGRRYPIKRRAKLMLIYRRRLTPVTMWIYIRSRYRRLKRRGRYWGVRLRRGWRRVIRGKRTWYYRYSKRWLKIRPVRLSARVGRRKCRIRRRGRRLYARIGRHFRRVKTHFTRFIRVGRKLLRLKRRGRKVVFLQNGKWTRLRLKRFRE